MEAEEEEESLRSVALQNATSMALDTRTKDLFVTELRANRIVTVLVPK